MSFDKQTEVLSKNASLLASIVICAIPIVFCMVQIFVHRSNDSMEKDFYFASVGCCITTILLILAGWQFGKDIPVPSHILWALKGKFSNFQNRFKSKKKNI